MALQHDSGVQSGASEAAAGWGTPCSLGKVGGFKERLEDGTWLGHVAEHVALELQRQSGAHISRGKTRSAGPAGQYNVIYGYAEERVGVEEEASPSAWSTTS